MDSCNGFRRFTFEKGDTVLKVCFRHGLTLDLFKQWNPQIMNEDKIKVISYPYFRKLLERTGFY